MNIIPLLRPELTIILAASFIFSFMVFQGAFGSQIALILIFSDGKWEGGILTGPNLSITSFNGNGTKIIPIYCDQDDEALSYVGNTTYKGKPSLIALQKVGYDDGFLKVQLVKDAKVVKENSTTVPKGMVELSTALACD